MRFVTGMQRRAGDAAGTDFKAKPYTPQKKPLRHPHTDTASNCQNKADFFTFICALTMHAKSIEKAVRDFLIVHDNPHSVIQASNITVTNRFQQHQQAIVAFNQNPVQTANR